MRIKLNIMLSETSDKDKKTGYLIQLWYLESSNKEMDSA